jgi:hypothetical protein
VVWKESGSAGMTVVPGDVLMQMVNCEQRFIEVTLPERLFGDIAPGDIATVQLKGDGRTVTAPVTAVLGAGAKFDHPLLAAAVPETEPDHLRVLISLARIDLGDTAGNFCQVGRSAEVRIARRDFDLLRRGIGSVSGWIAGAFGTARASASPAPAEPRLRPR